MSKKRSSKRGKREEQAAKGMGWQAVVSVAAAVALFAWLASGGASGGAGPDPETIALGGRLYATNCAACHGAAAEGEDPLRPGGGYAEDGTPLAPALNGRGHTWHHPPSHLFMVIKDGSAMEGSPMAGWMGKMTDDEIRAVMAWFRSLWPEDVEAKYRRANP